MADPNSASLADDLFSDSQNRLLSLLPGIMAIPSWIGSGLIIYVILKQRRTLLKQTYHRLMLGISISDTIYSLHYTVFIGTWSIPSEAEKFAIGADAPSFFLCNVQGWFNTTFTVILINYTMFLMIFYLLKLVLDYSSDFIARRIEPMMHTLSIASGILYGSLAVGLRLINPSIRVPGQCLVGIYPPFCNKNDQDSNLCRKNATLIQLFNDLGSIMLAVTFTSMVFTLVMLLRKVWKTEHKMRQYAGGALSAQLTYTRDTGIRAILYTLSFLSFGLAWMVAAFYDKDEKRTARQIYFRNGLLFSVFAVSQGTWNVLIYLRPGFRELTRKDGILWFLRGPVMFCDRFQCCRWLWSCKFCTCCCIDVSELERLLSLRTFGASFRRSTRGSRDGSSGHLRKSGIHHRWWSMRTTSSMFMTAKQRESLSRKMDDEEGGGNIQEVSHASPDLTSGQVISLGDSSQVIPVQEPPATTMMGSSMRQQEGNPSSANVNTSEEGMKIGALWQTTNNADAGEEPSDGNHTREISGESSESDEEIVEVEFTDTSQSFSIRIEIPAVLAESSGGARAILMTGADTSVVQENNNIDPPRTSIMHDQHMPISEAQEEAQVDMNESNSYHSATSKQLPESPSFLDSQPHVFDHDDNSSNQPNEEDNRHEGRGVLNQESVVDNHGDEAPLNVDEEAGLGSLSSSFANIWNYQLDEKSIL